MHNSFKILGIGVVETPSQSKGSCVFDKSCKETKQVGKQPNLIMGLGAK